MQIKIFLNFIINLVIKYLIIIKLGEYVYVCFMLIDVAVFDCSFFVT